MKKLIVMALVLTLCLAGIAYAEFVPSRTTSDLIEVKVQVEIEAADTTILRGKPLIVHPITAALGDAVTDAEQQPAYARLLEAAQVEITKLSEMVKNGKSTEDYFGSVTDSFGNPVSLREKLGTDTLNVFEFVPLWVSGYKTEYGKVKVCMTFATPYAKDDTLLVMIGRVTLHTDGTQEVTWTAYEGVGQGEEGGILAELDPQALMDAQNGTTLLAIVSR